jgi:hypothetical protein
LFHGIQPDLYCYRTENSGASLGPELASVFAGGMACPVSTALPAWVPRRFGVHRRGDVQASGRFFIAVTEELGGLEVSGKRNTPANIAE